MRRGPPNGTPEGSTPGPAEPTRRQRLHSRIQAERERLEAARTSSSTVGFAFDAVSYDTDTGAPVLAAALGFRVFLFQVPYVCFFVIIAGELGDLFNRDPKTMFRGRGIAQLTAQSVSASSSLSSGTRVFTLLVVTYALFLGARSFVKVLYIVYALVWNVPRTKPANANLAALLFIAFVTAAAVLLALIDKLRSHFLLGAILSIVLYTLVPLGTWWYVSWWLPHRKCPLVALLPGAALFAIGSMVLQIVTIVWFPHHLASKSELYGTLGVSAVLLLWAYLFGRVMTLAAVLNAALWARFGTESDHPTEFHRPSWRVPLIDDRLGRLWAWLFDDQDSRPGDGT
jgi:uncharacterized BrkB/YihY/UPF0761 family membrane protein